MDFFAIQMLFKYTKIIAVVFTFLTLISCALKPESNQQKQKPQIRIVDLDGNPKQVQNFVPEYNAKVLASQGVMIDDKTKDLTPIKTAKDDQKIASVSNSNSQNSALETPMNLANNSVTSSSTPAKTVAKPVVDSSAAASEIAAIKDQNNNDQAKKDDQASKEDEVVYDLSDDKKTDKKEEKADKKSAENKKFKIVTGKEATKKSEKSKTSKPLKSTHKGLFIQIGSYSSSEMANKILSKNSALDYGQIQEATVGGKKFYRVMFGPVQNQEKAEELLKKASAKGHKDAFIIKK